MNLVCIPQRSGTYVKTKPDARTSFRVPPASFQFREGVLMRLTAEQKRRQWEMRTERLVKLISLRATPSIVVFECRLVIGSYGWRRFWWEIIKYKLDNFKRKWWKSAETKAFEKQMEEWDNERDGQQG